jgi:hypothetical protein
MFNFEADETYQNTEKAEEAHKAKSDFLPQLEVLNGHDVLRPSFVFAEDSSLFGGVNGWLVNFSSQGVRCGACLKRSGLCLANFSNF